MKLNRENPRQRLCPKILKAEVGFLESFTFLIVGNPNTYLFSRLKTSRAHNYAIFSEPFPITMHHFIFNLARSF